ncbi:MAG: hypothetical protein HUU55_08530 [Myxococcales bacterium]|nr:hypothetical protein [Myxococcales bacterium]
MVLSTTSYPTQINLIFHKLVGMGAEAREQWITIPEVARGSAFVAPNM